MDAADDQPNVKEFKDMTIRQMAVWTSNLSNRMQGLWTKYAQQILLQSDIAARLSDYAELLMADDEACISEHKSAYTNIKLLAIEDYRMCAETHAVVVLTNVTTESQRAWVRLREVDKKIAGIKARCNLKLTVWFLNAYIRMIRDFCTIEIQPSISRELKTLREKQIMDLYRKTLATMLENGKQLEKCISDIAAGHIKEIETNKGAAAQCIH